MKLYCLTKTKKSALLLAAGAVIGISAVTAAPPKTLDGAYATVTVGDLPGMIDRAAGLAKTVNPGISGEVIRGQLGMLLGDPNLESVPAGSGMIAVKPTTGKEFFILLETADGKAQNIADMIKQRTGAMTKAVDGKLVAVAMNDQSLSDATGDMGKSAAAMLADNDDKFIVATVDANKLMQDKGADIRAFLKSLPQKAAQTGDASSSGTGKALEFAGNMFVAAASRMEVGRMKIDASEKGLLFEKTLYPVGGMKLENASGPSAQELRKLLPAPQNALAVYEFHQDMKSVIKGMTPVVMEALERTGASASDRQELQKITDKASEAYGDAFAGWISPDKNGSNGAFVFMVADQQKALDEIQMEVESLTTGSLSHLIGALGLKTSGTLEKNVGTVEGQPVYSISMSFTSANGAKRVFPDKTLNTKFAFIGDKLALAIGNVSIDDLATAVKGGAGNAVAPLEARKNLPDGGFYYVDFHMGALSQMMADQDNGVGKIFDALKDSAIYEAAYADEESLKFDVMIPADMISKIASSAKQFAQQHSQNKMQELEDNHAGPDSEMTSSTQDEVNMSTSSLNAPE